jgi:hypothetical protein
MVEEAGVKVTDLHGIAYNPYHAGIISTNGFFHDQLLSVVNGGSL